MYWKPIVLLAIVFALTVPAHGGQLWPLPKSVERNSTTGDVDPSTFRFQSSGVTSDILVRAVQRYFSLSFWHPSGEWVLEYESGVSNFIQHEVPRKFVREQTRESVLRVQPGGRNLHHAEQDSRRSSAVELRVLQINVLTDNTNLSQWTDESYSLHLVGPISMLTAQTVFGALRGLETFSQLVDYRADSKMYSVDWAIIEDAPRFNYRGLLIDSARHYLPLAMLYENLDAMSYNKLNVLHWHLTDDQSFPFVSTTYPRLSEMGAFNSLHIYTPEDIKNVIAYARDRGIRVIPEFDSPGHSASWGKGYPKLLTECSPDGFGPLNPIDDYTYEFVQNFFSEVAQVFPDDYLHLGGDEVSFDCWASNPDIQEFMLAKNWTDYSEVENMYERNLLQMVASLGKQYIVWQEIFNNGIDVLPETVIDVWIGFDKATMFNATKAGLHVILSGGWYLDHLGTTPGFSDWETFYLQEPLSFGGDDKQNALVLGGKSCMWGEHVDGTNFISRVWPRASAVAERLWSPQDTRSIFEATPRLEDFRCRMNHRNINAEPINPGFCDYEFDFRYKPPY